MWQCIYGCNFIQNYDKRIVFQIEKSKKKCHFWTFLPLSPSSAPERFLRMSPGFIMSGVVQVIRSTYVPNSTI